MNDETFDGSDHEPEMPEAISVPPQLAKQGRSTTSWVLLGCGIGCGITLLVLAMVTVVIVLFSFKAMQQGKKVFASQFADDYEKWKQQGKIPEEHAALFDELASVIKHDDASFWVVMVCATAVSERLDAGRELNAQDVAMLEDLLEVVRDNPQAGLKDLTPLFEKHPDLIGRNPGYSFQDRWKAREPAGEMGQ